MNGIEEVLRSMTFEFFGSSGHKIPVEKLFETEGAVLLDVRAHEEVKSVQLRLEHHVEVLHIPTDEVPDRLDEIPRDRPVGVFCSAGTRSAIVYAYLRSKGYDNVRVVLGGYEAITEHMLPGKLLKHIRTRRSGK